LHEGVREGVGHFARRTGCVDGADEAAALKLREPRIELRFSGGEIAQHAHLEAPPDDGSHLQCATRVLGEAVDTGDDGRLQRARHGDVPNFARYGPIAVVAGIGDDGPAVDEGAHDFFQVEGIPGGFVEDFLLGFWVKDRTGEQFSQEFTAILFR
jgi:hypothetical protein